MHLSTSICKLHLTGKADMQISKPMQLMIQSHLEVSSAADVFMIPVSGTDVAISS